MQPEKNLIFLKNLADFPLNNYIQPVVGSPDITGLGFFIHVQNAFFFQKSRLFFYLPEPAADSRNGRGGT